MLAAFATVHLLRRSRRRTLRVATVVLLVLAMAAEYAVVIPVQAVPWGATVPQVYRDLRTRPAGPVVELPSAGADPRTTASFYMLASTFDGHPRLNGWSGFEPRVSARVLSHVSPGNLAMWLGEAKRLGARYLVVHAGALPPDTVAAIHAQRDAGVLTALGTYDLDELYNLQPDAVTAPGSAAPSPSPAPVSGSPAPPSG